jgi:hypothetical protein
MRWQNSRSSNAPVAQLDRAFGYEPKGRTFESCRAHNIINDLEAAIGGLFHLGTFGGTFSIADLCGLGLTILFSISTRALDSECISRRVSLGLSRTSAALHLATAGYHFYHFEASGIEFE